MACHDRPDYSRFTTRAALYDALEHEIRDVVASETDPVANMANAASAIYHALNAAPERGRANWAGFYVVRSRVASSAPRGTAAGALRIEGADGAPSEFGDSAEPTLVLGPFMGKTAVTRIPFSKGVCGAAARGAASIVVPDVHAFPGHIACDEASQSEVVVPLFCRHGTLRAVIDIDSPVRGNFSQEDAAGLERVRVPAALAQQRLPDPEIAPPP